jgi:hypothetical protein
VEIEEEIQGCKMKMKLLVDDRTEALSPLGEFFQLP